MGICLGHVDEHLRAGPRRREEAAQQRLRHVFVAGEQRTHLGADLTLPQHRVAEHVALADAGERLSRWTVHPSAEEALSRSTEDLRVKGQEPLEWKLVELDQAGRAIAAAGATPADVAVRKEEAPPLVVRTLRQNGVEADDAPPGPRQGAFEQGTPNAPAAKVVPHDVETDECVALPVERARRGGDDLAGAFGCEEGVGLRGQEPLLVLDARVPALGGGPGDRGRSGAATWRSRAGAAMHREREVRSGGAGRTGFPAAGDATSCGSERTSVPVSATSCPPAVGRHCRTRRNSRGDRST